MGGPIFSFDVSPRLMRPGSKMTVSRWFFGSHSSSPGRKMPVSCLLSASRIWMRCAASPRLIDAEK
jgi:hypothetical protein